MDGEVLTESEKPKRKTLRCDECPRCVDKYPDRFDRDGYHFHICGMSGVMVYTIPRKERRYSGHGYIHFGVSGCGLYETVEDALRHMTQSEFERWKKRRIDKT